MTTPTNTNTVLPAVTAKDFHQSCIKTEKAKGENWTSMSHFYIGKGWSADTIVCPKKDNGKLDHSKYVEEFSKELGEGAEFATTIRMFQQYISPINTAKAILSEHGPCAVETSKGNEEVVSLGMMFNWGGVANQIAPKHILAKIIKSVAPAESPLKALQRALSIFEQNIPLVEQADKLELDVIVGKIGNIYADHNQMLISQTLKVANV